MHSEPGMVIVGAGHSGARAAHALRDNGWNGPITLLGNEGLSPYDRPPLSKAVLLGEQTTQECLLYRDSDYTERDIDLLPDAEVTEINRASRVVSLRDGTQLGYLRLLIATGAAPRALDVPGAQLDGVHYLRTAVDAMGIIGRLDAGRRLVIVGAGFIGMEIAATAVARGCKVSIIEAAPYALMRAVPRNVAQYLVERHQQMGVDVRFGVQVERIGGRESVDSVHLLDGTVIPCDSVIVGIGVIPRVELAEAAGIDVADGIAVDDTLCTNDPHIFACGDVCSFPSRLFKRRMRLECWKNAEDQARIVARNMLGCGETYSEVPWFWSDQYDLTIQIAGMPAFSIASVTRIINEHSRIFFAIDRDGVLVGASGVGRLPDIAKDIRVAQTLIGRRAAIDEAALGNPAIKLKSLLAEVAL
ncbi:pyridine nucleotide-disulfide oxidoreductase [Paraburkholderia dipogonis]|uniref:Pyridine nucleotide-disulfide oxidoreductase n=2 Tax=Paraburkholderia dipogonis TaxID=1211383 RepID=A0A4Y8MI06_9BURK|nr:pyridine nucleotide-disulfide oxidoreductase [Paraburkholderia dipogonis]